jgi:PAS domain S-box-containing protein
MFSVLYVDDEQALLELGKLFLERTLEFRVDVASSAIDALASPAFPSYDVIVSDYQMPEMDGIAFLKIVRERFGDIPFILFTGRGREDVVIEAINNGADFYLQKGGDVKPQFAELSHKIRQALARRQAEHSLRESEKRLADIINFLPDATFAINREGVIIAWNRAIDEMTGLSAEMMLGKGDHEYALPFYGERRPILIDLIFEPSEVIEQKYSNILRQKDVLIADTNLPRLQGREVTLVGKASPLYNSQGEIVGAIEAIRDITEQKRAEDELQAACEQITASEGELREQLVLQAESEAKYRELAELLPQIVFEMDRNLIITFVNRQGYTALGFTPEDVLQGFNALSIVDPLQHAGIRENIQKIINKEPHEHPEYSLMRKDGSTFPALIYSDPVYKNGALSGFRGIIIDISDRKKTENALHESEATLLSILRAAPVGIGLVSNRVLIRANDWLCEMTGYSAEELIGRSARILYPDDEEFERVVRDKYEQIRKFGTGTIETRWQRKDGDIRDILMSSTPLDPENHATGVTFTALDITERKQLENTLVEQQAKLTSFMQNLPVGVFRTTPGPSGRRIMVNPIIASMHGFDSIEELMQTPVADNYADAAMRKTLSDRLLQEGKLTNVETQMKKKNGELFWASFSAIAVRGPSGEVEYFDGVLEDITDRKRAEDALRIKETVFESSIAANSIGNNQGFITSVNTAFLHIWRYRTKEDAIGKSIDSFFAHEKDAVPVLETLDTFGRWEGEFTALRVDGSTFIAFGIATVIRDETGKQIGYQSTLLDITERKRAEEELRSAYDKLTASEEELRDQYEELASAQEKLLKSQEQLEEIAGTVPGVVYQFYARPDGSMGVYYVSSRADEVFGLDTTTQDFFSWFTGHVDPRDRERFLQSVLEVVKVGQPWNFEGRFIKPSGEKIWFQGISHPIARQGELVYSGVLLDITQRKLTEVALHESEEKYRTLVETTGTGFVIIDEQGLVLDANPEYIHMSGHRNLKEIVGRSVTEWTAAYEKDRNEAAVHQCISDGYIRNLEIDYVNASGTIIPIEINATVLPHGDTVRILTLCRDISKRRITQEALRESEEKYRTVIEQSHDGIFIAQDGLLIFHNPSFATLTGYSSAELAGRSIADLIAPEDRELVLTRYKERLLGKVLPEFYEFSVLHHDGTSRIRVKMNITLATIGGRPATIGTLNNVMEERKRGDALLESEARLSSILHGSPTLQFVIDKNHLVISWNKAIEDYSGIKAEDIVGTDQQWRAFYPEKRPVLADLLVAEKTDDIPKLYGGKFSVSRVVESAYEATDFFPAMGVSGKWLNFTAAPIRDAQGTIIGAVETLEDITERRIAEQAVIEANHKLNLLNSITRHDVANQLTILQGYAQIASMKKGDPVIADYLAKILTAADTIARQIEFTRTYQELGVRAPAWISVEGVITHVESLVTVKFSGTCRGIEVFADPMLERVFFNLFDNAVRHGVRVTEITVRCEREPNGILVIVEDNGTGIPAAEKEKIFERGVGKNTGLGLFLVREILSITGINIKETGVYGKGARFEISVPEGKYRYNG